MVDFSIVFLKERGVKCLFIHHRMLGRGTGWGYGSSAGSVLLTQKTRIFRLARRLAVGSVEYSDRGRDFQFARLSGRRRLGRIGSGGRRRRGRRCGWSGRRW